VIVNKYRRRVLINAMLTHTEQTMPTVCAERDSDLFEFDGETDNRRYSRLRDRESFICLLYELRDLGRRRS